MCRNKFLLIIIPRDLVAYTCLIGILSIESSTDSDSVLSLYIEPISVKSDLVVFRVSLFQISHLLIKLFAW